jgi:nitrous oxide reductase
MRKIVNWAAGFGSHGVIVKRALNALLALFLCAGCATTMVKVGSNGMIKTTKVQAVVRNENKVTVYFYSPSRTVEFAIKNEGEWRDFMSNLEKNDWIFNQGWLPYIEAAHPAQ